jgi:putative ATPase
VPPHLKDAHYAGARKAGFGADYKYPHDCDGGFVPQEYLPGPPKQYYAPKNAGYEKNIRRYLQSLRTLIDSDETCGNAGTHRNQGSVNGEG